MLRVPKVIVDVVPPGLLRRDAERAWALFQDSATCAIVLVTLPEEMPTTETIELAGALRELGLPDRAGRRQRASCRRSSRAKSARRSRECPAFDIASAGDAALVAARDRAARERLQAESLGRLSRELPIAPSFLPLLLDDPSSPDAIRQLAKRV